MSKLLSLEMHKLFRAKTFYIWTLVSIACSFLFFMIPIWMHPDTEINNVMVSSVSAIITSPICLCIGFFLCGFICNDFENGILKNVISRGFSRKSIFTAKYIITFISSAIIVLLNYIVVCLIGVFIFGYNAELNLTVIMQAILMILGFVAFSEITYMCCVLIRKQGPVIGINTILVLAFSMMLSSIKPLLHLQFDIQTLWLLDAVKTGSNSGSSTGLILSSFICVIVYFVLTYIGSTQITKKYEI